MNNDTTNQQVTASILRANDDALDRLDSIAAARLALDSLTTNIVMDALTDGATWQDIGDALGVSRQAAHAKWSATAAALGI